jgi:hypothetical protein
VGHPLRQGSDLAGQRPPHSVGHFRYARHFLLITCFGVLLAVMTRRMPSNSLSVSFASYGALHAGALVLTLRAHQTIGRKCLFIVSAAFLSAMTLRLGIFGAQLLGTHSANAGLYLLLGLSAAVGAAAYGLSMCLLGIYALPPRSLAAIAAGCLSAELAALWAAGQLNISGSWWFAVCWWFAFSGGLWYCDRRRTAAHPNHRLRVE